MVSVMISVDKHQAGLIEALIADETVKGRLIQRDRITGAEPVITAMVVLTPVVLSAVVKVLREKWTAQSKVSIEARGIKVKGVSPDDVGKLLKEILEHDQTNDD
jgi:hypothetical protein